MLVELFNFFSDSYGPLRVFDYLSFRAIFATLTALFVSLILVWGTKINRQICLQNDKNIPLFSKKIAPAAR